MKRETEELLNRLFESPLRRAPDAPRPGLNLNGPICTMPDSEKMLVAQLVHAWSVMGFGAAVLVERLADLSGVPGLEEKHAILLKALNDLLDTMKILDPLVEAVSKFGLKLALLNCQLDRAEDSLSDLEFIEAFKGELLDA